MTRPLGATLRRRRVKVTCVAKIVIDPKGDSYCSGANDTLPSGPVTRGKQMRQEIQSSSYGNQNCVSRSSIMTSSASCTATVTTTTCSTVVETSTVVSTAATAVHTAVVHQELPLAEPAEKVADSSTNPAGLPVSDSTEGEEEDEEEDGTLNAGGVSGAASGGPHPCVVCRTMLEHHGQSRPLPKHQASQYGLQVQLWKLLPEFQFRTTTFFKNL